MIGYSSLREIVGSNLLRTVTGSELGALFFRIFLLLLLQFNLIESRAKKTHRLLPVLHLGTLFLTLRNHPRRNMNQTNCGRSLVDVLSAGTGRTEHFHFDIGRIDLHFHIFHFRHNCHRRGRSVDSSSTFRFGHSLHTMHARLILQAGVRTLPVHDENHFLQTAESRLIKGDKFRLPAPFLRIACIHPIKGSGKERRFLSSCAATNLHHDILVIIFILRKQKKLNLFRKPLLIFFRCRKLFLRHLQKILVLFRFQNLQSVLLTLFRFPERRIRLVNRLQVALLKNQFLILRNIGDHLGNREILHNLFVMLLHFF